LRIAPRDSSEPGLQQLFPKHVKCPVSPTANSRLGCTKAVGDGTQAHAIEITQFEHLTELSLESLKCGHEGLSLEGEQAIVRFRFEIPDQSQNASSASDRHGAMVCDLP
jgi:hypothetical protein